MPKTPKLGRWNNSPDGTRAVGAHPLLETLEAVYVRAFPVLVPGPSPPCSVKTRRRVLLAHPLRQCLGAARALATLRVTAAFTFMLSQNWLNHRCRLKFIQF